MAVITKRPNGRYQVRIRRQGFPPVFKTFRIKKKAEVFARREEAKMDSGEYGDRSYAQKTTVRKALQRYYDEYVMVHRRGHQQGYLVQRLKKEPFAAYALTNLKEHHIREFMKERRQTVAEKTVRDDVLAISHLYNYAVAHWSGCAGLTNPVVNIKFDKPDRKRNRRLEAGRATLRPDGMTEEQALFWACEKNRAPWLRDAVELLIETAMRRGELAALLWGWVDLRERQINLPAEVTKTNTARSIPMTARAEAILKRMAPRELLLPVWSPDRNAMNETPVIPAEADYISRRFAEARKLAGLEDLRLHDLRHEAASRFGEMRLTTPEIMSITGHKTQQMLARYTHLSSSHMRAVIDELSAKNPGKKPVPPAPGNDNGEADDGSSNASES
jgi:integrase